jgi:hypothetical protein
MNAQDAFQAGGRAHLSGDYPSAERLYRLALDQDPGLVDCQLNLGILLRNTGRPREARPVQEASLVLAPDRADLQWALGLTLLTLGDYAAGWPFYERRSDIFRTSRPNLPVPKWAGEPLAGKRIAVFPEQGVGDAIQFARFLPLLVDQGGRVLLLCKPSLTPLVAGAFAGVETQSLAGQIDLGEIDYWVSMLSLPYRLGITLETLPSRPYLRAPAPRPPHSERLRVGLMTSGNANHENDARRSLDPEAARRLRDLPDVDIVSLHPEDSGAGDFAQTADIIAGLDLVISVDTSVGHLAGAMGKRTFLLVPGVGADWRWMTERTDSPWYPHHRLFRGAADGGWSPVIDEVAKAVADLCTSTLTKGPPPPT